MLQSPPFEVFITGTHSLLIPDAIGLSFRNAKQQRVAIKASFNASEISFHGKLHYVKEQFIISFGKRYQKELGVTLQDFFTLQLFEDTTKYGVEMPEEFAAVLESDPEAFERFEALSNGKKRSLIYFIIRIKNVQTRVDKALNISENLKRGITDLKEVIKVL